MMFLKGGVPLYGLYIDSWRSLKTILRAVLVKNGFYFPKIFLKL